MSKDPNHAEGRIPSLFADGPDEAPAPAAPAPPPRPSRRGRGRSMLRGLARRVGPSLPSPVRQVAKGLLQPVFGEKTPVGDAVPAAATAVPETPAFIQRPPPAGTGQTPPPASPAVPPTPDAPLQPVAAAVDPLSPAAKKRRTSSRDLHEGQETRKSTETGLETIQHTGQLEAIDRIPRHVLPPKLHDEVLAGRLSCGYCGVGDSGDVGQPNTSRRDRGKKAGAKRKGQGTTKATLGRVGQRSPTLGCSKLALSTGMKGVVFPIHLRPSILDRYASKRRAVSYQQAIERLADLVLDHRDPDTQILVYSCGQIDYFTIFAMQEIFRLLGVRNISGNAEHCLNAGAVHNEMLTGQEGPFLTFDGALDGPNRFFVLNGWNGVITHPGAWNRLFARKELDAYLIDVMESDSARLIAKRLGEERVLLVRSGSDPHLALSVAHEILWQHQAVDQVFLDRFADSRSWRAYRTLARSERFAPDTVAERIAPEPRYAERLTEGIRAIAARIAAPDSVPINIPSVGLSQTKGAVGHCLWGNAMAMVGKYGLRPNGSPAGGTLRIPGQINAESEVMGLNRDFFFGRVPMNDEGAVDAARRMGLPDDAYELAVRDEPRPVLDYSDDRGFDRELIITFGTQFEANMMDRNRWRKKLESEDTTIVVVDPIPDPYSLRHAHLVIPSPPHAAATKLYQNGEWRMSLSTPRRQRAPETRTDATILYDAMAEISKRIRSDSMLRMVHPDLGFHSQSGYLKERFEDPSEGGGLPRYDGEVSRPHLWERVLDYTRGGEGRLGTLYCQPCHADGSPIAWMELVEAGDIIYGGVGETRYVLATEDENHHPFADVFGRTRPFRFFHPTEEDLSLPQGIILNSGRSSMSARPASVRFSIQSFSSGKATPAKDMPEEHPLYLSLALAEALGLKEGDALRVRNTETGEKLEYRAAPTERLKGQMAYIPFHKDKAQVEQGRYLNELTSQSGRCPYTAQTALKSTQISLERIASGLKQPA